MMAKTFGEKGTTFETRTIRENSVNKKPVAAESQPVKETTGDGGIRKEYLNDVNLCRVTFKLPKEAANGSESVYVVGDFNNWDINANQMTKTKNGDNTAILELERGREYQFRYLIDGSRWENDWNADRYVKSCYGDSDNSVVVT
ncbi:MAG: isoamylase early set domain-containing protein [Candidatus Scalindua sp.]|nr:isoamylase early set domain-containing protein [Candidatus Scalindua sp.]